MLMFLVDLHIRELMLVLRVIYDEIMKCIVELGTPTRKWNLFWGIGVDVPPFRVSLLDSCKWLMIP